MCLGVDFGFLLSGICFVGSSVTKSGKFLFIKNFIFSSFTFSSVWFFLYIFCFFAEVLYVSFFSSGFVTPY